MVNLFNKNDRVNLHKAIAENVDNCSCVIGFDAFIDHITKPIRKRNADNLTYFETLNEYSRFLLSKGEMSGAIELDEVVRKYGGNNPIMSYALGKSGVAVHSIGAYGELAVNPEFSEIQKFCTLYPFTMPGECWSYEFASSKLMNYINMNEEDFSYESIVKCTGNENLINIIENSQLVVLVNYSEQTKVIDIWNGIIENTLPNIKKSKNFFFDLSDCTRISKTYIHECHLTMLKFKKFGKVYLSLNQNEFLKLTSIFIDDEIKINTETKTDEISKYVDRLKNKLDLDCLILRTLDNFYTSNENGVDVVENIFVPIPKCLTGAGDNQNAGICIGIMCGLNIQDSLKVGALYGNFYIKNGRMGSLEEILLS